MTWRAICARPCRERRVDDRAVVPEQEGAQPPGTLSSVARHILDTHFEPTFIELNVVLCHGGQRATSNEQRATSNEQRAMSNEQRASGTKDTLKCCSARHRHAFRSCPVLRCVACYDCYVACNVCEGPARHAVATEGTRAGPMLSQSLPPPPPPPPSPPLSGSPSSPLLRLSATWMSFHVHNGSPSCLLVPSAC